MKAIQHEVQPPHTITLDGYAAPHRALREMRTESLSPKQTTLRCSEYLNNLIEQDHRGVNSRTQPMLGIKNLPSAAIIIAGVLLLRRIHKNQFALKKRRIKSQAAPVIWNAVLAAQIADH